jgi:hypothetical protein
MEGTQFDAMTRTLAQHPSRRGTLKALAAGVAVLVGAGQTAEARRRRVRQEARGKGPDPCAVRCADQPKARGAQCRQVCRTCEAGPAGLCLDEATGAFSCKNFANDRTNCGGCGVVCPESTPSCAEGACCVEVGGDCDATTPCCGAENACGVGTCGACLPENSICFMVGGCCPGLECKFVGPNTADVFCVP